jgi:D-alanine-D-alanine ligase
MNLVLLYGGRSSEHEVSLVSAAGVLKELASLPDYNVIPLGITRTGIWHIQDREFQLGRARSGEGLTVDTTGPAVLVLPGRGISLDSAAKTPLEVDCVFPVLHGSFGEDGTLQGLLEMANLPYVGSGVVGSSVGMDKIRSKQLWHHLGIPIVPYIGVRRRPDRTISSQGDEVATAIDGAFGFPVFVKPNAAGSSVGVTKVTKPQDLPTALERAFAVDSTVLVEQAMMVREIETAVLGNDDVRSFPPGEVIPTHEFYDYAAKYEDPDGARLAVPAELSPGESEEIQRVAREAFRAVDGAGFARVDCFLDSRDGNIYVNEINTIPGFTPISMYPKMVQAGGLSYVDLLQELIGLALDRADAQRARNYAAR